MSKKLTTEEFIDRATKIHGKKYDYSESEYKNSTTKVKINCPKHGVFYQLPFGHMSGKGCKKCGIEKAANNRRTNRDDFIKKSKAIHGERYCYSKFDYKTNRTKSVIICNEHGSFLQTPTNHLKGNGCPVCAGRFLNTNLFIEKAKKIHGDRYDYSRVSFKRSNEKVPIFCSEHGLFMQRPNCHLSGKGCLKCRFENQKGNIHAFVKRATKIHGKKYDYSESVYKGYSERLKIVCPDHGAFYQTPAVHISQKSGCPECSSSKGEKRIRLFLQSNKLIHSKEWTIPNTRLRCDFFLTEAHTIIEYDGRQHFQPIEMFGGEKAFKARQKRDSRKNAIAEKMGLKMIRIPYWDYDNIESILQKHLL